MPDGPWRCSECGTVNEPVANSCRTCGRWPSLFDLESSQVDQAAATPAPVEDVYAPEVADAPEPDPASDVEPASQAPDPQLPPEFEADD